MIGDLNRMRACWLITSTFFNSLWLFPLSITAFNVLRPSSPQFLSSLSLPNGGNVLILATVTLFSSAFQAYLLACCVQITQLIWGPMLLFMFTMSDIAGGQKRGTRGDVDGNQQEKVSLYRELQLLTDEYNNLLAPFHAMLHGTAVALITLDVYLFVRTEGMHAALGAYLAIWSLLTYCELMNNYAEIQRGSTTFMESLRVSCYAGVNGNRTARGGWVNPSAEVRKKELRSFRELRIKGGSSGFYFDKQLILTFLGIILDQCVNLLIMT